MTLSSAAEKSLATILELLTAGDFYSAHQKARTSATRLLTSRNGPNVTEFDSKAQDATGILWEGARRLLEAGQIGSGVDLGLYLVSIWEARGVKCGDEERAQVLQLIALTGPSGSWRKTLTDAIFSWSAKTGANPAGDAAIHGVLGETLCKEGDYQLGSLQLLLCPTHDAAKTLAEAMYSWSKLDPEGIQSAGRYAARGMLSYLESLAILPAKTFLSHFLSLLLAEHPDLVIARFAYPPPESPLARVLKSKGDEIAVTKIASINFLQLTLKNCQIAVGDSIDKTTGPDGKVTDSKGKGRAAWIALLSRYEKEIPWLRTAAVKETTVQLGTLYFGIKPPRPAGNPMMDMLSNMFSGGGTPPAARGAPAIRGR